MTADAAIAWRAGPFERPGWAAGDAGHGRTRRLRDRRRWLLAAVGLVIFAFGAVGADLARGAMAALASSGAKAQATVVVADIYQRGYTFDAHLIVSFRTGSGAAVRARVWIDESGFWVGEQVPIVYDAADPQRAQLDGDGGQVGPLRVVFLVAQILGTGVLISVGAAATASLVGRLSWTAGL
jgi:hypothetical protein